MQNVGGKYTEHLCLFHSCCLYRDRGVGGVRWLREWDRRSRWERGGGDWGKVEMRGMKVKDKEEGKRIMKSKMRGGDGGSRSCK